MKKKILIAGASGMVGRALQLELKKNKKLTLLIPTRKEVTRKILNKIFFSFFNFK